LAAKASENERPSPSPSPYEDPTALAEALLGIHSAVTEEWLVEAAVTAAERSLGALYTFIFLTDASGRMAGREPASEARARALNRVHKALGQPLARMKLSPDAETPVGVTSGEHRPVSSERLADLLAGAVAPEDCDRAQKQLGVAWCCLSPVEMSAQQLGVALFMFGKEGIPVSHIRLLCDHLAQALINLRQRDAARHRGEIDPVRWVSDERRLTEQLEREMGRATRHERPLSIMILRVSNLEDVACRFGRFLAERLLRRLGAVFSEQVRGSDFLGSYQEDGFALIMAETDAEAAARAAGRLLPFLLNGEPEWAAGPRPELRYGVASFPEDGSTAESLLATAEARLEPALTEDLGSAETAA
jgi:diguanylate cyclase (GGDEF)-like protein